MIFSSAADTVSGAYPMLSCPSVRHQHLFKSNGHPQFSSDLSNIGLECAQQYCPKSCAIRILIVLLLFLSGCLIIETNWECWSFFQEVFNMGSRNFSRSHSAASCVAGNFGWTGWSSCTRKIQVEQMHTGATAGCSCQLGHQLQLCVQFE